MIHADWKKDRRQYLRFGVDLPIELVVSQKQSMRVKALGISAAGMHFLCDRWDAQLVIPPGYQVTPANPLKVTLRFQTAGLGDEEDKGKLNIFGEIISSVRLAENLYRVNVRFASFWGNSKKRLEEYLEYLQEATA